MSRYELPKEQHAPGKLQLAVITLAFYGMLCAIFFGTVTVLAAAYSWLVSLVEAML